MYHVTFPFPVIWRLKVVKILLEYKIAKLKDLNLFYYTRLFHILRYFFTLRWISKKLFYSVFCYMSVSKIKNNKMNTQ